MLTKYPSKSWLIDNIFFIGLCILATFPLFPLRFQIILFAIAGFTSVISYLKKPTKSLPFYSFIIHLLPFILLIISLLYTENSNNGKRSIETMLSMALIPLMYFLNSSKITTHNIIAICKVFMFSTLLKIYASALIVILNFDYYYSIHYNVQFFEIFRHSMEDVSGIHALYINMLICSNILLSFFVFYFDKKFDKITISILALNIIIHLGIASMIASRAPIIALFVCVLILIFTKLTLKFKFKLLLMSISVSFIALLFLLVPALNTRLKEIINTEDVNNSTNVRYQILDCSINSIKESPIIGHGVGDDDELLLSCYKERLYLYPTLSNYNSHNQYISFLLRTGGIGLTMFLILLFHIYSKLSFKESPLPYLVIFFGICMFTENILERQIGIVLFYFLTGLYFFNQTNNKIIENTIST